MPGTVSATTWALVGCSVVVVLLLVLCLKTQGSKNMLVGDVSRASTQVLLTELRALLVPPCQSLNVPFLAKDS